MTFTLSAALIFSIALLVTIRWAAHHPGHALVAFLAGFFVAGTGAAPVIHNLVESIAHALGRM
jgi:hypothetical protein